MRMLDMVAGVAHAALLFLASTTATLQKGSLRVYYAFSCHKISFPKRSPAATTVSEPARKIADQIADILQGMGQGKMGV